MYRLQLPPPANWQDFESLCLAVWRDIWGDPDAQKNGRLGQPQAGVDVFGSILHADGYHGVQCKLKESSAGELALREVSDGVRKAESFVPELRSFTIATTAKRDVSLQEDVRLLSEKRTRRGKLSVQVYAWDDILEVLDLRRHLVRSLYPEAFAVVGILRTSEGELRATIVPSGTGLVECDQVFNAPEVRTLIVEGLRIELRNVATELILNAAEHGRARSCSIALRENLMVVEDDGTAFDPLSPAGSKEIGVGLLYLEHFLRKWDGRITGEYARRGGKNVTTLRTAARWSSTEFSRACTVLLKERYWHGPILSSHAEFPEGCLEYSLTVPHGFFNPSSLMEFIHQFFVRVPPEVTLRLHFAQGDLLESIVRHATATGFLGLDPARVVVAGKDG
jgi:hypothetical protein